jgi:uncharacterized protein with von Willebrand factor type A (vWA) domain
VLLDRGGLTRYDEHYVNVKRMRLAMGGLVRGECPGDSLQFVERYTFARPRHASEAAALMDKPVTLFGPWVRKKVNRSDQKVSEVLVPPHFTNTRHGLQLARQSLAAQNTANRQVLLITDGLQTAHFGGGWPDLLYPPDRTPSRPPCARRGRAPARASPSTSSRSVVSFATAGTSVRVG